MTVGGYGTTALIGALIACAGSVALLMADRRRQRVDAI
jgi:hypothetical protein